MENIPLAEPQRPRLVDEMKQLALDAFGSASESVRAERMQELEKKLQDTSPISLIPALTSLTNPKNEDMPAAAREYLMRYLVLAPMRPTHGVRATLEFVFAVHPSSSMRRPPNSTAEKNADGTAKPDKRGAPITQEALKMATRLLAMAPPERMGVTADEWYNAVGEQLLILLDGADGEELVRVAAYVVGFGVLGNKKSGMPGTPGWKALAEPLLAPINPSLVKGKMAAVERDEDEVIELSRGRVLVTSEQLALALRRLTSLLHSHPNPGLTRRMLRPVFLALWSLASWPRPDEQKESSYCKPARRLLEIFLRLTDMAETLGILGKLIQHLTCKGGRLDEWSDWAFDNKDDKSIHVVVRSALSSATPGIEDLNLGEVNGKASALVSLMKAACSDADISALFLDLFKRWFEERNTMKAGRDIIIKEEQDTTPLTGRIFELQILQKLMDELPDKLMGRSDHMLELVSQMIGERDEDVLGVTLSLLNLVITSPLFRKSAVKKDILEKIETSLDSIKDSMAGESASTARNLSLLLRYRDELQDPAEAAPAAPTDRQVEDRKTYKLGLSYITQADAPPPVRVEGLNLISGLIVSNSPVLDITSVIVLLCTLLAEDDDYINMKVIKMFTQLTTKHPRSVVNELVDRYVDASEKASVDTRLRFGEALLQVIERLGETFTGDLAKHTCESLLSIAGRRGYRPKTEKRQQREAQRAQMKRKEADDAWGGEALELSEDEEEAKQDEKTKARNAILAAIVAGWESKRGSEDVRVRASALAIVRTALETSLIGVGPSMASAAVDLCLDVLAMEPEMEKAILRRAAITVILSFVLALNKARERRVNLGFGLEGKDHIVTVLEYIAEVDNDGLVQQHARDALESLENWTVTTLQPTDQMQYGTLNSLAGLSVNPLPGSASKRPRIEEVE